MQGPGIVINYDGMKQVLQNLKTGKVSVEEVPAPLLRPEGILVRSRTSLISAGTERTALKLGQKSLVGMARERPDLVRRVLDKLKRDGFLATMRGVRDQLDRELPLGYSVCGEVIEAGAHAARFHRGQLVACAGAGHACHAEINYIPDLLAVPVPAGVASEAAAYATVGAIALQGVRNADAQLGEAVVVVGLGLVGQLTVQLLTAAGCRVAGLDVSAQRIELARRSGAEAAFRANAGDLDAAMLDFTRGRGADAVIITAATKSNEPVELAARLARDRARVVMVGVTGMDLPRTPYYHKELTFIVSRSYGPGRYDPDYEERGHDYPIGYVRWTENRNLEAFLDMVAAGRIHPELCTTHRFPIERAVDAYNLILESREPHLGVLLTYPESPTAAESPRVVLRAPEPRAVEGRVGVSFVGAGSFARSVLLPALKNMPNALLRGVASSSGVTARSAGKKFGFEYCAGTVDEILADKATQVVFVATPHRSHAELTCRALEAGKTLFVEKPLAVDAEQLEQVVGAAEQAAGGLMVGFNRRFAPLAEDLKKHVSGRGPLAVQYRCNAGALPPGHWLSDPAQGGRIVGEACHFFDFFQFLTGSMAMRVHAVALGQQPAGDDAQITISYADGSVCELLYTSQGASSLDKERVEVFAGGRVGVLEDFRRLSLYEASGRPHRRRSFRADKGHIEQLRQFLAAVRAGRPMPIGLDSLVNTTLVSFAARQSLRSGEPVALAKLSDMQQPPNGANPSSQA